MFQVKHISYTLNYKIYFLICNSRHTMPTYICYVTCITSIRTPSAYEVISQRKWPSSYEWIIFEDSWHSHLSPNVSKWSCHFPFFAHLSWPLKWVFLITCRPASVCLSDCKIFTFSTSPPEPLGQFQSNLTQCITFVQMKGHALFQG